MLNPDTVQVIHSGDLLDQLFGDAWYTNPSVVTYDITSQAIIDWCKANGAAYYADDNEEFSLYVARRVAAELGLSKVVVENLS